MQWNWKKKRNKEIRRNTNTDQRVDRYSRLLLQVNGQKWKNQEQYAMQWNWKQQATKRLEETQTQRQRVHR